MFRVRKLRSSFSTRVLSHLLEKDRQLLHTAKDFDARELLPAEPLTYHQFLVPKHKCQYAFRHLLQEKDRQLRQIAKDFDAQELRAAELLIDVGTLGFLSADSGGGLRLSRYDNSAAHARATLRGQRLLNL